MEGYNAKLYLNELDEQTEAEEAEFLVLVLEKSLHPLCGGSQEDCVERYNRFWLQ
jgi:hypothetical protein